MAALRLEPNLADSVLRNIAEMHEQASDSIFARRNQHALAKIDRVWDNVVLFVNSDRAGVRSQRVHKIELEEPCITVRAYTCTCIPSKSIPLATSTHLEVGNGSIHAVL